MSLDAAVRSLSLTEGWVHTGLTAAAVLGLTGLALSARDRSWWTRRLPLAVAVVGIVLAIGWLVVERTKSWPDGFPADVLAWAAVGLLGPVLVVVRWRRLRPLLRAAAVGTAVLVLLGAADAIDTVYGAYPTLAAALQLPPSDTVSGARILHAASTEPVNAHEPLWRSWQPPAALPAHGQVAEVSIPATRSGFRARAAWLYVPPAYLVANRPPLPVLMLLGGQPGSPRDWVDAGQVVPVLDAFAAKHGGLAPLVVMPDPLGGETANTLCMNSALGRVDTYLAQDVSAWALSTLHAGPDHGTWAVGGFSFGGTCALQLTVAHPDLFRTFFDASGQVAPTLGNHARTVAAAFPGSPASWASVDPLTELRQHRYDGTAGWFVVGAGDHFYQEQQRTVTAATAAAGITTLAHVLPGRHSWALPRAGFAAALPWLATRMGLAP